MKNEFFTSIEKAVNEAENSMVKGHEHGAEIEEDRPFAVVLNEQDALNLRNFFEARMASREKNFQTGWVDPKERRAHFSDGIAAFESKLKIAMGTFVEPKVYCDVTRGELDELGKNLVEDPNISANRVRFTKAFRKPVIVAYLNMENDFVNSGGAKNEELRQEMEELLTTLK